MKRETLQEAKRLEEILKAQERTLMHYNGVKGDVKRVRLSNGNGLKYVEEYLKPEQIKVIETLFKSFIDENRKEAEDELNNL